MTRRSADGLTPSQRRAQRIGRAALDADRRRPALQPPLPLVPSPIAPKDPPP